jgi:hypothetical protein
MFVFAMLESSCLAQTMNLSRKSGVPFAPSHKAQPVGTVAMVPCHMRIMPAVIS